MGREATEETRLFIIRHGESQAQAQGFLSGHDTCTGLSDLGRRQAEALRDRLVASGELLGVDAVYTSILPRAIETAAIIAPGLGGVEAEQECAWCEIHAGEGEGLTWEQFREKYPDTGNVANPFKQRMPGAESWAEFYVRAGARLTRVAQDHPGQRVVVAGHGGIVGASFVALGGLSIQGTAALTMETINTSITEWRHRDGRWTLVRYNDAAHLAGLPDGTQRY